MSKIHWVIEIEGDGIVDMDEIDYLYDKMVDYYNHYGKPIVIKKDSPMELFGEIEQGGDVDEILAEHNKETK